MAIASEVSIYIKRGDLILGPFSESQTVRRYHRGEFRDGDLAMIDGMTGWHPLATYIVDDEADAAPPSFDASAPPAIPQDEPPPRFDLGEAEEVDAGGEPDETSLAPLPERAVENGPRSPFGLLNPVGTAWALLGLGVVVMVLSRWPWLLYLPLILGTIGLAVHQLVRRNFAQGGPLLAVALLAPWFVWSQWLSPAKARPEKPVAVESPMPTPARVIVQPTPAPEPPKAVVDVPEVAPAPLPPEPAPEPPPEPVSKFTKGQYVALTRDTKLLFEGKEFRLGRSGERFQVLATSPDKIYLKSKTVRGQVIAITAPPDLLKSVPAPGQSGPTIIE